MEDKQVSKNPGQVVTVPLGGNAFITRHPHFGIPVGFITDIGLVNWTDPGTICSVFVKLSQPETFVVSLRVKVEPAGSRSNIRVSILGQESYVTTIEGAESYIADIGSFSTNSSGYVQLGIQGISKTGPVFGEIAELILSNVTGEAIFISDPELFYFGRRGPSIHFSFGQGGVETPHYFYSEIKVPLGEDILGSYFMANGFSDGYFGIQVNSRTERRVLFSVWSEFPTDDPGEVPEEYQVQLLKKGENVQVQDFGNEGTGKQSFMKYPWVAEETYKFLIYGTPIDAERSTFTAWFRPPGSDWQLIASFMKPKVSNYLSGLYSFLENFITDTGHLSRKALFGNQWVKPLNGDWKEIVQGQFTGDETSRNGRHDFAGGVSESGTFFLKNCGFFDDMVETGLDFTRPVTNNPPDVDFGSLP